MWSTLLLQIMCLCECHMNDRAHMCHCGSCSHASLRTAQGQRTGVLKPQKSTAQWAIRNISPQRRAPGRCARLMGGRATTGVQPAPDRAADVLRTALGRRARCIYGRALSIHTVSCTVFERKTCDHGRLQSPQGQGQGGLDQLGLGEGAAGRFGRLPWTVRPEQLPGDRESVAASCGN